MLAAYPPGDCEVQTLKIDPEFQSLIPPLAEDERAELETSLKSEGCRHPLDVWHGVIVDGHNRYAICQAHGIPFEVKEHEFEDRDAAKEWILRNQLARRNLNDYSRGALALRLKGVIAARAKARMLAGKPADPVANLPQGKTRDALADVAGVSGRTIDKVEAVERDAPEPVKIAARAGDISTNRAYEITRALKALPEADRARAAEICIDHDEKARTLVRLHKSQHTDPDSNGTYEEILRTGGFHYGDDMEKWCDYANDDVATIARALKSVAKHHARQRAEQRRAEREAVADAVDGAVAVIPLRPAVKPGDWWQLGEHRLFCGDTSSRAFIDNTGRGAFAFADPPYNANVDEWDRGFKWFHDWLIDAAPVVAVTPGIASIFEFARVTSMPYVWSLSCWIDNGMTRGAVGFGNWIYVALFSNKSIYRNAQDIVRVSINASETKDSGHKGRKPSELLARLLELFSKPGDVVIDPFLGSGTTLLVAEEMGRVCVGGEINPDFCEDIIARWENLTGNKAAKIDAALQETAA